MKTISITDELTQIVEGINQAADIVKTTMGAEGKTVIIGTENNRLRFTKDGVSVAKSISLEDDLQNVGAQVLISSADETVNAVGDGTTLTSVLLQIMVNRALYYIEDGKSVNKLLDDMEVAVNRIVEYIKGIAKKVETYEDIYNLAKVASNSEEIAALFKKMYEEIGMDSLVTLERSQISDSTYYEVEKGVEFESGYVHSAFITDKVDNTVTYEYANIHINEDPITGITTEIERMMEASLRRQLPLIIIAPKFSDAFIRLAVMNKVNSNMPVCLIASPGFGGGIKKNYDDIRAFMSEDGTVQKIKVTSHDFIIYNNDTPNLKARLKRLKSLSKNAKEWYDEKDYMERYHKLNQSVATIFVGGKTPEALSEEYDRVEDALGSVKTGIKSGYVEGAGITLFRKAKKDANEIDKLTPGEYAVYDSLFQPFKQILQNANINWKKVFDDIPEDQGFNVKTKEFEYFLETGIIDPAETLVQALLNAFASTRLVINTSYVLINKMNNKPII